MVDLDCSIIYNDNYSIIKNIKDYVDYPINSKNSPKLQKKDIYNILNLSSIFNKINYNLNLLEQNNKIIIKYFDNIDNNRGYLLLTENSKIELKDNQLKLFIIIQDDSFYDFYKENVEKDISKLKSNIDDSNNSYFSDSITDSFETPTPTANSTDIIILSSNPLVEKNKGKIKELYTIYDNVSELTTISRVLEKSKINLNVEFNILTTNNLILAIKNKTKILHLICKTSYDDDNKLYFMFENENCELVKIKEKHLIEIFMKEDYDIKKFKRETLLIINTQFLEDSLEIFINLGFEKIIIEHSIPTNNILTNRFNRTLYENLINERGPYKTQDAYNNAKPFATVNESELDKIQLCCCFHKHSDDCKFKIDCIKNNYEIAHFNHLRYKCSCTNTKNNFINHNPRMDENNKNFPYFFKKKSKTLICCDNCKNNEHNYDSCFKCFFKKKEDFSIFFASKVNPPNFNNKEIINKYKNLNRLIGRNEIIYDIICDLNKKIKFINIYGEYDYNYNYFAENLSGYLLERINKKKIIYIDGFNNEKIEFIPRNDIYIINMNRKNNEIIYNFISEVNNYNNLKFDFQLILITKTKLNEIKEIKFKTYELKKLNENELKIKLSVEKKLFNKNEFDEKINS